MATTGQQPAAGLHTTAGPHPAATRIHFLDNLRTAMIFLVVLYHAGAVYESSGIFASFWLVDDPSTNDVVGIVNLVVDIFVMPVIFFVSGYLATVSLRRRPGVGFLAHRFRRLMIPWLIAMLTLVPLYKVIFLYSRGLPQEHWTTYFHFSNGIFSQSWLWFLPVLFLFDALFWAGAKAKIRPPRISMAAAVAVIFVLGVGYSFALSVTGHTGWTKTPLLDFQNERLLMYFLVFLLGALSFRLRVFETERKGKGLYIAAACTAWIPLDLYVIVLLNFFLRPGQYFVSLPVDLLVMWIGFYLSLLMLLYLLLVGGRFWWNRQGRLGKALSESSYGVYIIHLVVVGGIALLLLDTGIPSLWKAVILTVSAYAVSSALVYGYRELLKRPLVALATRVPRRAP
jgi:peptidoglycan/LPS O-acetylase OafA/YrhL